MKIRRRKYRSGKVGWQLDLGEINGRRVQIAFKTKEEAEGELARRKAELRRVGEAAFLISDEERRLFVAARDKLAAVGAGLDEAVEFYLRHAKPAKAGVTLRVLIDRCLEAKREEGKRERYLYQLKCSANSFAKAGHEQREATAVTTAEVVAWLRSNQWAPKTWNVYRGDLRTVLQWGCDEGYLTMNAADGVPVKQLEDDEVRFLSVGDVASLLKRAAAERPGAPRVNAQGVWVKQDLALVDFRDCLAALVLGLFCGLRPERELGEMLWSDVREDVVIVQGRRAKSRQRRVVDLSVNARAWLARCPSREGKILPPNFTRKWKALRQAVGLFDDWPHDGMRHTFATMWLAFHGDEKRLQLLMGHESAELIYKHYRGLTTRAEAERFWGLVPDGETLRP